jgi:hypothetical protein
VTAYRQGDVVEINRQPLGLNDKFFHLWTEKIRPLRRR